MKYFILLMVLSANVNAYCSKSYVCNNGNCGYIDVCDSTLDLPSINLKPLQPLPNIDLKPLPSLALPPLGTSKCQYMSVNGVWQNVCY